MKCHIPEISWHNREPVLSVDFQRSNGEIRRLATAGVDKHVLIWYMKSIVEGDVNLEFVADLVRHEHSVNVVRFSPTGELLASGDDDGQIFIWKKIDKGPTSAPNIFKDSDVEEKENWTSICNLRGHIKDVHDLSWSPNGDFLASGSVDNSAILWNVRKGKNYAILSDHKGFVQGVAWDPLNQLVATLCSDRCCRIYSLKTCRVIHKIYKAALQPNNSESSSNANTRSTRLFHDDTLKSFCRRLTFTPDGELLIAPSGIVEKDTENYTNVTYVFSRQNLSKPVMYFPTKENYTTVVRCCPVFFNLRSNAKENENKPSEAKPWEVETTMFKLPYRMVFAVATQSAVFLYDTQQRTPFAHVANMHFTGLSDMSWSDDGRILIISSTDGYCSFITFTENELGVPFKEDISKYLSTPEKVPAKDLEVLREKKVKIIPAAEPLVKAVAVAKPPVKPVSTPPLQIKKRVSLITLFSPKLKSSIQLTSKSPLQEEKTAVEGNRKDASVEDTKESIEVPVKRAKFDNDEIEVIYQSEKNSSANTTSTSSCLLISSLQIEGLASKEKLVIDSKSVISSEPMEVIHCNNSSSKINEKHDVDENREKTETDLLNLTDSSLPDGNKNDVCEMIENVKDIVVEKKVLSSNEQLLKSEITCKEQNSEIINSVILNETLPVTSGDLEESLKDKNRDSNVQNAMDVESVKCLESVDLEKSKKDKLVMVIPTTTVAQESVSGNVSPVKLDQPQDCFTSPTTTKLCSSPSTTKHGSSPSTPKCLPGITKTPRRVQFITLSTPPKPRKAS
ncbi:hypothetical protein CHUAL_011397 [Chamberlinius hualienensis]